MLKIFFFKLFFRYIEGITLFLPQEIIISKSEISIFLKTNYETGVKFGGINFQKLFSSTFWCINLISKALAKPSTWLIMPCKPSVNNNPFNLLINYYIALI